MARYLRNGNLRQILDLDLVVIGGFGYQASVQMAEDSDVMRILILTSIGYAFVFL